MRKAINCVVPKSSFKSQNYLELIGAVAQITCARGSTALCWWRHAKSIKNNKIRPRADPKPLKRLTQNLTHVIMSAKRPNEQNFLQIRSLRAFRQMGKI